MLTFCPGVRSSAPVWVQFFYMLSGYISPGFFFMPCGSSVRFWSAPKDETTLLFGAAALVCFSSVPGIYNTFVSVLLPCLAFSLSYLPCICIYIFIWLNYHLFIFCLNTGKLFVIYALKICFLYFQRTKKKKAHFLCAFFPCKSKGSFYINIYLSRLF